MRTLHASHKRSRFKRVLHSAYDRVVVVWHVARDEMKNFKLILIVVSVVFRGRFSAPASWLMAIVDVSHGFAAIMRATITALRLNRLLTKPRREFHRLHVTT